MTGDGPSWFACPRCHRRLTWTDGASEASCDCGARYEVVGDTIVISAEGGIQVDFFRDHLRTGAQVELSEPNRKRLSAFGDVLRGRILEIGSGDASFARSNPQLDITSTDVVLDGLEGLGRRAAVCPADLLPFQDDAFDAVVALEVLEHVDDARLTASISEIHRVLKPGGLLLVSVPLWPPAACEWILRGLRRRVFPRLTNLDKWDYPHVRRFRPGDLENLLRDWVIVGVHRWFRSGSALSTYLVGPLLRRVNLTCDLASLDNWLWFDWPSNKVLLASKRLGAGKTTDV